jgi:type IX secretion system PorP/SprF family membrane protein
MKITRHLLFLILLLSATSYGQQLPYRSAFSNTDFLFNPAMTAVGEYLEWGANYRQQWLGFEEAPITATGQFQYPFLQNNMSAGASISLDKAGPLQRNGFALTYSYKMELGLASSDQLSLGILAGINQYRFDVNEAVVADADDLLLNNMESSSAFTNFGFGLFYVSNVDIYSQDGNGFFFGLGTNQLFSPQLGSRTTGLPRAIHANAIVGARFNADVSFIEPSIWANYSADNIFNLTGNILFEMADAFWTGLSFSTDQTVALQGGFILKNGLLEKGFLRIGGQGTYGIGSVGDAQGLGFEVLVGYRYWL